MGKLDGKTAVITGAANGIGAAMARLFAAEGAEVVIADVDEANGEHLAGELPHARFVHTDVARGDSVSSLFAGLNQLDILVNNAISLLPDPTITDLEEENWDRIIAVCLKGPYLCTKYAIPLMRSHGRGSIVTMSSVNALFGVSETAYTAAKGGLVSMMRLVAAEYGGYNIRSNIICPGTIATANCMSYWNRFPEGYAKLTDMYPLKRIGQPEEVARYALFLASDDSAFVTGSVVVIDGGLLAGRKLEI
jgi:NAD(P)-dependent dehydrogenase (short-subunit alcohol dehydrogenase family)